MLGEEMLILALILKGPGRSIALSSLQKREINMFLKAKQAACGVCVWASLISPDAFREKLLLKKNDHISRSSGFISNTYLQKHDTCERHVHNKKKCLCLYEVSRFAFPLSPQNTSQCLRSTNDTLSGKINRFPDGETCAEATLGLEEEKERS